MRDVGVVVFLDTDEVDLCIIEYLWIPVYALDISGYLCMFRVCLDTCACIGYLWISVYVLVISGYLWDISGYLSCQTSVSFYWFYFFLFFLFFKTTL